MRTEAIVLSPRMNFHLKYYRGEMLVLFMVFSLWLGFIFGRGVSSLKWLYVAALMLSVLLFLRTFIINQANVRKGFVLQLFFILSFLPSVLYAQYDTSWALSQFFSLVIRAAPAVFLFGAIASDYAVEKAVSKMFWLTMFVFAVWSLVGVGWVFEKFNFENIGGSVLVMTLPFMVLRGNVLAGLAASVLLILSDSRMGGALSLYVFSMCYFIRMMPRRLVVPSVVLITILSAVSVVLLNIDVFFPDFAPEVREYEADRIRRAMQYYCMLSIKENPILGIGMGQVNLMMESIWGQEVLAHGFMSYIWAQSGLLPLMFFFLMTFLSVYRPAKCYVETKDKVMLALAISNITGFLFFLTRPQQDNPIYFLFIFWGVACFNFRLRPHTT